MQLLTGKNVLVTRTKGQAQELSNQLKKHGASTIEIPTIEFGEPSSWQDLDTALGALSDYDWVLFASANAVSAFQNRLSQHGLNWLLGKTRIAAIGSATSKILTKSGVTADFIPTNFVAEKLIEEFSSAHEVSGLRILWPRTNAGRTLIADQLRALGASVNIVEAYTTNLPHNATEVSAQIARLLFERKVDVVTFASSQTAKNFYELLTQGLGDSDDPVTQISKLTEHILLAVIGPITAETTRELFGRVDVQAETFNAEGLVEALLRFYEQPTPR